MVAQWRQHEGLDHIGALGWIEHGVRAPAETAKDMVAHLKIGVAALQHSVMARCNVKNIYWYKNISYYNILLGHLAADHRGAQRVAFHVDAHVRVDAQEFRLHQDLCAAKKPNSIKIAKIPCYSHSHTPFSTIGASVSELNSKSCTFGAPSNRLM